MILNMILTKLRSTSLPAAVGELTYNGSEQSPDYDADEMNVSGVTKATNAGTYTMICKPKNGYEWADGTSGNKEVQWTIAKANSQISMNASSVHYLWDSAPSLSFTLSKFGDGAVSAVSSNPSVATVTISGDTVTVSRVNSSASGNVTITLSIAGTDNCYAASATYNFVVNVTYTYKKYNTIANMRFELSWGALTTCEDMSTSTKRQGANSYDFDSKTGKITLDLQSSATIGTYTYYPSSGLSSGDIYQYVSHTTASNRYNVKGYPSIVTDKSTYSRGTYIEDVVTPIPGAYPDNGKHTDGYWYVKQS